MWKKCRELWRRRKEMRRATYSNVCLLLFFNFFAAIFVVATRLLSRLSLSLYLFALFLFIWIADESWLRRIWKEIKCSATRFEAEQGPCLCWVCGECVYVKFVFLCCGPLRKLKVRINGTKWNEIKQKEKNKSSRLALIQRWFLRDVVCVCVRESVRVYAAVAVVW